MQGRAGAGYHSFCRRLQVSAEVMGGTPGTMSADPPSDLVHEDRGSRGLTGNQNTCIAVICLLTWHLTVTSGFGMDLSDRETSTWLCEEWTLENASWSGNPFDLIATVLFVHPRTGEQRTTQMFYAGDNQWKFRFTGTRTGIWSFSTSSSDPDLDGHTGTVTVGPRANPKVKGFLTHVANKYAIMGEEIDHLEGYVYQVFMNQQDYEQQHEHSTRILGHPSRANLIAITGTTRRTMGLTSTSSPSSTAGSKWAL